ncbi:hypothetical protein P171DRAFT_429882 [Karstenula rhodostoma CBS 690.94]|uniref:Uncharacterized protein n=1 Tax=Karstenula rhodostoma CBS 690.94 TaxID=1392251 RepID=A0A9P4PQA6_9PLEO|nr:hypothetical protein P171DRAFT_429882 [Karstenula rhodostoma CBS 690.94]
MPTFTQSKCTVRQAQAHEAASRSTRSSTPPARRCYLYILQVIMAGTTHAALDRLEQTLAKRNGEYDIPDDLLSSSDADDDEAAVPVKHRPTTTKAREDTRFPHLRKHTLTGTIKAHTQIYVVNEQIIHGKTTWSTTLCAFDSLHSANTDARTRAVFQHANGNASLVHVQYRNGYGTWTTILETERGRITKSVFVNATVLQHMVAPLATAVDERSVPGDRLLPSRVPGSRRVRQIQAFRSTDSIRAEIERPSVALEDTRRTQTRRGEPLIRQHPAQEHRLMANARAMDEGTKQKRGMRPGKENAVSKQRSIDDLREFASLHTLL